MGGCKLRLRLSPYFQHCFLAYHLNQTNSFCFAERQHGPALRRGLGPEALRRAACIP